MWARLENGIVAEIVSESPAGRFHPDLEFMPCDETTEIGDQFTGNGYQKTPEPPGREIAEARGYLASTDWYIIREFETGKPTPANIKAARADARTKLPEQSL